MTTMPSRNTEGHQVWNPSVGVYFKPDADQRESYGGIIGALNDQIDSQGGVNKAYPHNFAGIIAAIENLTFTQKEVPVAPDQKPPGGDVSGPDAEGNYDWVWGTEPRDGELWFDTRQGRMFVAIDGEYYQTNGADGLAQVTTDGQMPPQPVVGQFWWDSPSQSLYIFDGFWLDRFGDIKPSYQPGYTPIWRLIVNISESTQTTGTLRLVNADPSSVENATLLPPLGKMDVQSDFNNWVFSSLAAIDEVASDQVVVEVGTIPPNNPSSGDLWYDSVGLELSIWYQDDNSGQWVPTANFFTYDAQINSLDVSIKLEEAARKTDVSSLNEKIDVLKNSDIAGIRFLEQKIAELQQSVEATPEVDLSNYTNTTDLNSELNNIKVKIDDVESSIPTDYVTTQEVSAIRQSIYQLPTVEAVLEAISIASPDVSEFVTQGDIDNSIADITTEYLPRTGGTINGTFVVEKQNTSNPAFDFSSNKWNGYVSHKYKTNSSADNYVTFGTHEKMWEYAWNFEADEDFCWVYGDANKVFSITKDGPACSQLYIGDIQSDNTNGRQIFNKIDVKDRLNKYQSAFVSLRQGVASATDFDELKANILVSLNSI